MATGISLYATQKISVAISQRPVSPRTRHITGPEISALFMRRRMRQASKEFWEGFRMVAPSVLFAACAFTLYNRKVQDLFA